MRHLRRALEQISLEHEGEIHVELKRIPFLLEPEYLNKSDDWYESHTARMLRKFGSVQAFEAVKRQHRLMPRAREAGLASEGWSDDTLAKRVQSPTLKAHRLIAWLTATNGWEAAETAYAELSRLHFVCSRQLNDTEVLCEAAAICGVSKQRTIAFLQGSELEHEVLSLIDAVHQRGIHSIPTLFVNGEYVSSGAMCGHDYLATLRQHISGETIQGRWAFVL